MIEHLFGKYHRDVLKNYVFDLDNVFYRRFNYEMLKLVNQDYEALDKMLPLPIAFQAIGSSNAKETGDKLIDLDLLPGNKLIAKVAQPDSGDLYRIVDYRIHSWELRKSVIDSEGIFIVLRTSKLAVLMQRIVHAFKSLWRK